MDIDSFILYIKIDDIYKDIAKDVETRSDTSNFELDRSLSNKIIIGLIKDELSGKIMTEFVGLTAKSYSYLIDGSSEDKKEKDRKKCVIKRKTKLKNYKKLFRRNSTWEKKNFIKNNKLILKIQQRFKSERSNAFTEEINNIALNSNDDKRMKSIDSIETYAYGRRKDLASEKEEIKYNNIIKRYENN